ncbi:MAG: 3-phosphoshikimate 1-carboxyvinyltransferase [Gemmataceae bacterium]|nr:3-phosphoshikimate 1-carboxyvinyltransferase [Gemmataceae bacterium]MCI0742898.1 3-phosphoshikimate 1-carboxyvinyltransferase [Gemmataceae bacterium]
MAYPDSIQIQPLTAAPKAEIRVPGSKSITNRALVLAALSDPKSGSELRGVLQSEDTEMMIAALRELGFRVHTDWQSGVVRVQRGPSASIIPAREADLFVGNSGTTMRFLTSLVALGVGRFRLEGVTRMRERPIEDLLAALRQLGVNAYSERGNGFPPVIVEANGLRGGLVRIKADVSSQYLSGLLMAAPFASEEVAIEVTGGLVSAPYVEMTLDLMWQFGVEVDYDDSMNYFEVPNVGCYVSRSFEIEPDASAASYFFAAAALAPGEVCVPHLSISSLQGDVRFLQVLEKMGCELLAEEGRLGIRGGRLWGIDVDMNDISDTVMTLAAVACFAEGPTTIRNVAHIRHKETNRLAALATELRRVGAGIEEFADGLTITPAPLHGAEIETYNDHRVAMSMALIGLKVPGIVIKNPGCVAKTYPSFFDDLEKLR